jgi:hypothetical protein
MMTSEEVKVLNYLRQHGTASVVVLAQGCLPGLSPDWVGRIVANLDWLGYLTVYGESNGAQAVLQITEKGRGQFVPRAFRPGMADGPDLGVR